MKKKIFSKEHVIVFIVLLLITFACLSLWYVRHFYRVNNMIQVTSDNGIFDLSEIDFDNNFVQLKGNVSYIPGILTPEEFMIREEEAESGNPWDLPSATSRIMIQVPNNSTYMITASSIDFAHRVYVNNELRFQAGVPAETAEDFVPGAGQLVLETASENHHIELIQQGANFVHREGSGHTNLYFGKPAVIQRFLALTFGPETIIVGLFAALFLVHLVLFIVRRSYKPNLIFSLLCLTWMIRSGITSAKVFYAVFPALPWQVAFRAEYLTLPLAAVLLVLLIRELFPGIMHRWFIRILCSVSGLFSILCLMMNTVQLSYILLYYEAFFTLAIFYLCIRFLMKVPDLVRGGKFQIEQTISLAGLIFFMFAAINDALYHSNVLYMLGFNRTFALTGLAMLIFSFFQMTAMFYGTMRETMLAHEKKKKAEAEKEMLAELNKLKSAFYTDLSHEMKTPLTVIAVNAQFAAQNINSGSVDEETIIDLNAISAEAKRLAQMVTSLVDLGRMQGTEGECIPLKIDSLITETARIYQALFARKKNTLRAETENDLPSVTGNADKLLQVLINLLSNANRHTAGGTVIMRADLLDHKVKVSVSDNGSGIDPELLPHVFERYCHGANGGSGLGLYICKTIVEEHGGEIGIESEEGNGTTVWFTLPIKGGQSHE